MPFWKFDIIQFSIIVVIREKPDAEPQVICFNIFELNISLFLFAKSNTDTKAIFHNMSKKTIGVSKITNRKTTIQNLIHV